MSEQTVGGPIVDAIKEKIAEIIKDPTDFIAFVKLLISLFPKEQTFSADSSKVGELQSLLAQASDS